MIEFTMMPLRQLPEWSTLGFSFTETDVMYRCVGNTSRDPVWESDEYSPFGKFEFSPATSFLSYGQGIFEGLKAQRTVDDRLLLFRPEANAQRFQNSAERLSMPGFPVERFVDACCETVRRNARWVPPCEHGSLYVRPTLHATSEKLGLGVSDDFQVTIFVSPVGQYFKKEASNIKLRVLKQGRVPAGGTGAAKAMGNYAGAIYVAAKWKSKGYNDVLYLDSRHLKYLTETSGSNAFVILRSGVLVTPPLDDQILPGVTRESALHLAREMLGLDVEERAISIDEVLADGVEMFCTGTAWTLLSVGRIDTDESTKDFASTQVRDSLFDILNGIQTGAREDPYGWILEV